VLGGHNEGDLSVFTALLETNNYEVVSQNLLTEEQVDPEAAIALLAMPQRDLTEDELRKLDVFLSNGNNLGKTLFYMASADTADSAGYPNLSAWLGEWGIAVNDGVVFETDPSYMLSPTSPFVSLVDYAESEYSAAVQAKQLYPAALDARPLEILFPAGAEGGFAKGSRSAEVLLQFSASSGVLVGEELPAWPPPAEMLSGPIPTLIKTSETRYDGFNPLTSHVLASGSFYSMINEQILGGVSFANAEYFLGLLNTLAGREDTIAIQDKTISMETMEMTANQQYGIIISVLIVLPLALLVFGIVVWLRRRHR
jgi:hypothetical protein